jgi:hypothetical protein
MMKLVVAIVVCLIGSINAFVAFGGSRTIQRSTVLNMAAQNFTPEELIAMAKTFIANPSPDLMAEDYVFRGPVIGPLVKKDITGTIKGVASDIKTAFPDMQMNTFGFVADDPIEPMRVWYFVRPRGTFLGDFKTPFETVKPTGAKLIGPPEVRSLTFNNEGKIKYATVGYNVDRFTGDTTKGKGAVFGLYEVIGKPINGNPGSKLTRLLQKIATYLPEGTIPRSYSKEEDIPSWWTDKRRGADA